MKNVKLLTRSLLTKSVKLALCAGIGLMAAANAPAHEFFVIPNAVKDYKAGDTAEIIALSTHYFNVGEEVEPVNVNEVYPVKGGKKGAALKLKENKPKLWYETSYKLSDDAPVIIAGNRKGGFWCTFTDGEGADGTKKEVMAMPSSKGKTVASVMYFAKYSKLYLNPKADDTSFSTPLGTKIEVIPLDNPAGYKKGAKPKFRVLFDGKPLANAEIYATYGGFDVKTENAYAQTAKTDAKGEASFNLTTNAVWLVGVTDNRPSSQPDTNTDKNSAIVVFMVK